MTSLSMMPNMSINGAPRLHDFTACYWLTMHPGTHFMKGLWAQDWNLMKSSLCCNFDCNGLNRSQICTCHDSAAVVACAKLWPDLMIMCYVTAACIFTKFASWADRLFVKLAPGSRANICSCPGAVSICWNATECGKEKYPILSTDLELQLKCAFMCSLRASLLIKAKCYWHGPS